MIDHYAEAERLLRAGESPLAALTHAVLAVAQKLDNDCGCCEHGEPLLTWPCEVVATPREEYL